MHKGKVYASSVDFTHFMRLGFIKLPQGWRKMNLAALEDLAVFLIKSSVATNHPTGCATLTQLREDLPMNWPFCTLTE